jgi:hypothetical protein
MGTVSFPGVKRPGSDVDHTPPPNTEVEERVEITINSPSGPSWPVLGWTWLDFTLLYCSPVLKSTCRKISVCTSQYVSEIAYFIGEHVTYIHRNKWKKRVMRTQMDMLLNQHRCKRIPETWSDVQSVSAKRSNHLLTELHVAGFTQDQDDLER